MKSKIQKWGNSLAVRIPKSFAVEAGLNQDAVIELTLVKGKVILTPSLEPQSLETLLAGITPANRHHELDFTGPFGLEAW